LTRATRALRPFSAASTVSLESLGAAGEVAGPKIRRADPVARKARDLARTGAEPTTNLAKLLVSANKTGGWDGLVDLIYNGAAASNEFDAYGHYGRTLPVLSNCVDYVTSPTSGCSANFNGRFARSSATLSSAFDLYRQLQGELDAETGGTSAGASSAQPAPSAPAPARPAPGGPGLGDGQEAGQGEESGAGASSSGRRRALLDYLLGP
jgi:hypothetical protein